MNEQVRRVLARYMEGPNEYPPYQSTPWLEYLKARSEGINDPDSPVYDMLEDVDELNSPFPQENPYDYVSPSDKPKDQKDSPPFVSNPIYPTEYGFFSRPQLWKNPSSLKQWRDVREVDWTTDEDEQQPAISITRKKLSCDCGIDIPLIHRVVNLHLSDYYPLIVDASEFKDFLMVNKLAATLNEIERADRRHYRSGIKRDRANRCVVEWINKNKPKQYQGGLFVYRVYTPGSKYGRHNVYMQFLRGDEKVKSYLNYPVHIACTCPSFLFWGAQFYAVQNGYMYMPAFRADLVSPRAHDIYSVSLSGRNSKGRGFNFRLCKHILAVMREVSKAPIRAHYRKYPVVSPPSKDMNKEVWKELMKFDFTEDEIKRRLKADKPSIPAYFKRENITPAVVDWFNEVWLPRSEDEKIRALKQFSMYPERVYFFLIKEAYLQRELGGRISDRLINEGFDIMNDVVQKDNEAEPQSVYKDVPSKRYPKGTGPISPPGDEDNAIPAEEFIKGESEEIGPEKPEEKKPKKIKEVKKQKREKKKIEETPSPIKGVKGVE